MQLKVVFVYILYALSKKTSGRGNGLLGEGELEGLWYCGRSLCLHNIETRYQ